MLSVHVFMRINVRLIRKNRQMNKRISQIVTIFTLFYLLLLPTIGAATLYSDIQTELDSKPEFQRLTNDKNYQYVASSFLNQPSVYTSNLEKVYAGVLAQHRAALGEPKYVPIDVSGITVIIPTYDGYKYVGDAFVQTRFIRAQIRAMLGRTLIDTDRPDNAYATESAQLQTLYANALEFIAQNPTANLFGKNLGYQQDNSTLTKDMIWPELRTVNGEEVLVPIVYLTGATVSEHSIDGHIIEFIGGANFGKIELNNVSVKFGRDAFINVANDLVNNGSTMAGTEDLTLVVSGTLSNLSGVIQTTGDLKIGAHSIESQTIVHRYDFGEEQGSRFGEIASFTAGGDVILRSYSDIVFIGADVDAGEGIKLAADGNIYIGSQVVDETFNGYENGRKVKRTNVDFLQSSLTAEETIQLIANSEIVIDAAEIISSQGHIEMLAGLGITVDSDLEQSQFYQKIKNKGTFSKTTKETSTYKSVAIRSLLDAGKNVRLHTEFGDITLRSAMIESGDGTQLKAANGGVNLLMTTETDHYSYSSVKKGLFTNKTIQKGYTDETVVQTKIIGGLKVDALNKVTVEYKGNPDLTLDEQIAELAKFEGLEWMADIRASSPEIDWLAIEENYQTWKESQETLSPAALAVVSIAVAVYAGPAAGALLEGVVGATAATAISAGAVALSNSITVASINGALNGDVDMAWEQFAREETFKNIAVAMVTAGAIQAIDAEFLNVAAGGENPLLQNPNSMSLADQVNQALIHSAVRSSISTVAYGGDIDEFGNQFTSNLTQVGIDHLGAAMATEIGLGFKNNTINNSIRYIAHAGTGCFIGVLSAANQGANESDAGYNCASGAGGAVVGEYIGDVVNDQNEFDTKLQNTQLLEDYLIEQLGPLAEFNGDMNSLTPEQRQALISFKPALLEYANQQQELHRLKQDGVDLAKLSAGFAALAAGGNVEIAAAAGENSAENNAFWIVPFIRVSIAIYSAIETYETLEKVYKINERIASSAPGSDQRKQALQDLADLLKVEIEAAVLDMAGGKAVEAIIAAAKKTPIGSKVLDELEALVVKMDSGEPYTLGIGQKNVTVKHALRKTPGGNPYPNGNPMTGGKIDEIIEIKKNNPNNLPDPSEYLSADYIEAHLSKFDEGALRFTSTGRENIGPPGGTFVIPKKEFDNLMASTNGDLNSIEVELGLATGTLTTNIESTVIYIIPPEKLSNIWIPIGNETGANEKWIPGGYTVNGVPEAVIDSISTQDLEKLIVQD